MTIGRRAFLIGGATGTALAGCRPWAWPSTQLEHPSFHQLLTLSALADAFLPGGDGTPGAYEANAVATIVDPAYAVNPYISEVVSDLDDWCYAIYGSRRFIELTAAERERAVEQRMGMHGSAIQSLYKSVYDGILDLTKAAFLAGLHNVTGTSYVAFPGTSTGYAADSAAGAYASSDPPAEVAVGLISQVAVDGPGAVSVVRLTASVTTEDDLRAVVRVHAPDGHHVDVPLAAAGGDILVDDLDLALTGGTAAGAWRLEVTAVLGGTGQLALWSLRMRTDLDERA